MAGKAHLVRLGGRLVEDTRLVARVHDADEIEALVRLLLVLVELDEQVGVSVGNVTVEGHGWLLVRR
jgi:hypothetical protein